MKDYCKYKNDGPLKADFRSAKKTGKKPNPAKTFVCPIEQETGEVGEDH
jgi:hypothetical protein